MPVPLLIDGSGAVHVVEVDTSPPLERLLHPGSSATSAKFVRCSPG